MSGAGAREYQVFLSRLDEALRQQAQILAQARLHRGRSSRVGAMRPASDGGRQSRNPLAGGERLAADKIEQKETDEHSQQLWSRRTSALGG